MPVSGPRSPAFPAPADGLSGDQDGGFPLPAPLSPRDRTSLQEKVHALLRASILDGDLRPGQRLIEHVLAAHFGVSRVPVREAIRRLEQEQLVVVSPRRAITVSDISSKEAEETYVVRMALEGMAARLAASRATPGSLARLEANLRDMEDAISLKDVESFEAAVLGFHDAIIEISGNARLVDLAGRVRTTIERYRRLYEVRVGHTALRSREHHQIYRAIADRDADRAERLLRSHLQGSLERLLVSFGSTGHADNVSSGTETELRMGEGSWSS